MINLHSRPGRHLHAAHCLFNWFGINCYSFSAMMHPLVVWFMSYVMCYWIKKKKQLWPPCTHPLMATSSRIMHHVTKLKLFQIELNIFWTWQWVHCTKMAPTVTRSQPNRASLGWELRARDVHPTNQLQDAILSIWSNISKECFQHLVKSMPHRILKVKRGQTQY